MGRKRVIFSILTLFLSMFAFLFATFAWFAVSVTVDNSEINISVDPGIIPSYDITFYTNENVYEYDSANGYFILYNSTYPNGIPLTYSNYSYFAGILMRQYDPLIPVNNYNNNVVLELVLHYEVEESTTASIKAVVDASLVTEDIIGDFDLDSQVNNIYYFSQVSQIQHLMTSAYASAPAHSNLYSSLTSLFNDTVTYPYDNFYDAYDVYDDTIEITYDNLSLTYNNPTPDIYIYFNFTYWTTKIEEILLLEGNSSSLNDLPTVDFFSDLLIIVREEGGV